MFSSKSLLLVLTCALGTSQAWTVPPQSSAQVKSTIDNIVKGAASFGVAASLAASVVVGPAPVNAADFTGSYKDPNHPNCARLVAIEGDVALVSGADGNPGCPTGEGRPWNLKGRVDGDNIFVDFSSKGGPKDLNGVWEAKKPAGIRWPDGNKWVLEGRPN